jgi:hypothetical protein
MRCETVQLIAQRDEASWLSQNPGVRQPVTLPDRAASFRSNRNIFHVLGCELRTMRCETVQLIAQRDEASWLSQKRIDAVA